MRKNLSTVVGGPISLGTGWVLPGNDHWPSRLEKEYFYYDGKEGLSALE